jgi:DNA-binding IclR family transcriptional regulator
VNESDGSGVKSAERALTILELFSRPGQALTFTQVAEVLGYPRSSLHGLLRTLTDRGWLRLDPATRRFSLGLRAWQTGVAYHPAVDLQRTAAPVVDELGMALDGAVHVSVLDDADAVAVVSSAGATGIRLGAATGACGQVLLAELDRGQRERCLAGQLDGGAEELHIELERVRAQGFAEGDSPVREGHRTLAVPLRNRGGDVVAAIALTAEPSRLQGAGRQHALDALRRAAEDLAPALASA